MREGRDDSKRNSAKPVSASIASTLAKSKKQFLQSAGISVWDADDSFTKTPRENVIEEWQNSIVRQSEMSQNMRAHVDEQVKFLQQQTIQRKAQEAALFASHTVALRLRAQAQQTEARVQRLANELKRIYQTLGDTIDRKLKVDGQQHNAQHMESELTALKVEHHSEFFKFLNTQSIQDESEACQKRVMEIDEHIKLAHHTIEHGQTFALSSLQHAKAAHAAIHALHDRWARFSAAGFNAGEMTLKDAHGNVSDEADCILQRATLSVGALSELIGLMGRGEALHRGRDYSDHVFSAGDSPEPSVADVPEKREEVIVELPELPESLAMPWAL